MKWKTPKFEGPSVPCETMLLAMTALLALFLGSPWALASCAHSLSRLGHLEPWALGPWALHMVVPGPFIWDAVALLSLGHLDVLNWHPVPGIPGCI